MVMNQRKVYQYLSNTVTTLSIWIYHDVPYDRSLCLYLDKFSVPDHTAAFLICPPSLIYVYFRPESVIDDALNVLLGPSLISSILSLFAFLLAGLLHSSLWTTRGDLLNLKNAEEYMLLGSLGPY